MSPQEYQQLEQKIYRARDITLEQHDFYVLGINAEDAQGHAEVLAVPQFFAPKSTFITTTVLEEVPTLTLQSRIPNNGGSPQRERIVLSREETEYAWQGYPVRGMGVVRQEEVYPKTHWMLIP